MWKCHLTFTHTDTHARVTMHLPIVRGTCSVYFLFWSYLLFLFFYSHPSWKKNHKRTEKRLYIYIYVFSFFSSHYRHRSGAAVEDTFRLCVYMRVRVCVCVILEEQQKQKQKKSVYKKEKMRKESECARRHTITHNAMHASPISSYRSHKTNRIEKKNLLGATTTEGGGGSGEGFAVF
jgi:hypothetical protein